VDNVLTLAPPVLSPSAEAPREPPDPLAVDAKGLARLLSCGERTVHTWKSAGRLPTPFRLGGRVLWRVEEIREWLAAGAPELAVWEARKAARRT